VKHLYIHIPFCQRRCSYCNFNTFANLEDRIEAYVEALCAEIRMYSEQHRIRPEAPKDAASEILTRAALQPTIFLGGGTPTMLSLKQIERVLAAADTVVPVSQAEVTTEANPGTVIDEGYLYGLRSLGINRISFGVQSLHDSTLRMLGRIHTAAEAIETCRQARRAGFARVNLDFIFGLPGQSFEQWRWTLDQIVTLDVDHLSLYSLILEEGTPLHHHVTRGSMHIPDDDTTGAMYELAMERLSTAGYIHYEISNWAKDEALIPPRPLSRADAQAREELGAVLPSHLERPRAAGSPLDSRRELEVRATSSLPAQASQHNVAYWLNADFIGCGAGAHGHTYPQRWHNIRAVDNYIAAIHAGRLPIAETIMLTEDDLYFETMMMGLRLHCGVSFEHFTDRCKRALLDVYANEVHSLVDLGLLQQDRVGVRLTERGRMVGNIVFLHFLREPPTSSSR
jgi:oxygen-independent coproporphyrinogen-3 oxidase